MGKLILTTGPSGAGKSTALAALFSSDDPPETTVSHTTRPMRKGEMDGKDYHFVSRDVFDRLSVEDRFAEFARIHGNYYGTTVEELKTKMARGDVVIDMDYNGARQIKRKFPKVEIIVLLPEKFSDLRNHLLIRQSETPESIETRMKTAREELVEAMLHPWFDYYIINRSKSGLVSDFLELISEIRNGNVPPLVFSNPDKLQKHLAALI